MFKIYFERKQEKGELNPWPLVLETTILPTELFSWVLIIKGVKNDLQILYRN
jgi:hypothetical protein